MKQKLLKFRAVVFEELPSRHVGKKIREVTFSNEQEMWTFDAENELKNEEIRRTLKS